MEKPVDIATRLLIWIGGAFPVIVGLITLGDFFAGKFLGTGYVGLVDITHLAVVMFASLSMPRVFDRFAAEYWGVAGFASLLVLVALMM